MIDWKTKLCSRKLWMAIAGLVSGILLAFKVGENDVSAIGGIILWAKDGPTRRERLTPSLSLIVMQMKPKKTMLRRAFDGLQELRRQASLYSILRP